MLHGSVYHDMAHSQVGGGGGGGDSLQIWKVDANILDKQSRTADMGWSSSLQVGWWANNPA